MPDGVVEVVQGGEGKDRLEVGWALCGGEELGDGEVADAHPADLAVAPGLGADPLDHVEHVLALLPVPERVGAFRAAGAARVDDYVRVAAGDEEIARAGLDEPQRRPEVLDLARVGREGEQRRSGPDRAVGPHRAVNAVHRGRFTGCGQENVGVQPRPVTGGDQDRVRPGDAELSLAELAVLTPRGLRAVQPPLPRTAPSGLDRLGRGLNATRSTG